MFSISQVRISNRKRNIFALLCDFLYTNQIKRSHAYQISFCAVFVAIAALFLEFSFPVPFFPPYLKIDFSDALVLFVINILQFQYLLILIFCKTWLAFLLFNLSGSTAVGYFASNIASLALILSFYGLTKLYQYIHVNKLKNYSFFGAGKKLLLPLLYCFFSIAISIVFTACILAVCNDLFLLSFYGVRNIFPNRGTLYGLFIGFNCFKFTLEFSAFLLLFVPVIASFKVLQLY